LAAHGRAAEALRDHPYFAIHQLVINGCGPALTPDDVRAWLGLTEDATLWQTEPARVRARVEAHPYVARAAVRREFPGRLEVEVRERRPRAIVVLDGLYYVDRGGATFGPLRPQDSRLSAHHRTSTRPRPAAHLGAAPRPAPAALLRLSPASASVRGQSRRSARRRRPSGCAARPRRARMGQLPASQRPSALQAWEGAAERLASVDALSATRSS
jgi:hypothetical protein